MLKDLSRNYNDNIEDRAKNLSKHSLGISIPILIIVMISYYMNEDLSVYKSLIEIFCASLGAALSIISIIRDDVKEGDIYKYIGVGFLFISLLSFTNVILPNKINISWNNGINHIITVTTFYLEYIIVMVALILKIKKKSVIQSVVIYLGVFITVFIFNTIMYSAYYKGGSSEEFYTFQGFIVGILAVSLILFILFDKKIFYKEDKQFLYLFIMFIIIYQSLLFSNNIWNYDCIFEAGIFKYMAYYMLYEVMASFLLSRAYDNMKKNLVDAQKMQKDLNNILSTRNKTLIEFKSIIEKSEKRYSNLIEAIKDGIIIFYFDRLSYINGAAIKMLGNKSEDDVMGREFMSIIRDIVPESIIEENLEDDSYFLNNIEKKLYKTDTIKRNGMEFEVFFLKIDSLNRLVYINDITEINKNHEIRREYEEYLKEEKLKNEFYSNISHELRTPINLIYSALQLNEVYLKEGNIESIDKKNDTIKQNCLRLIRTINNFIDTNKVSEGYLKPNMRVYNIVSVTENISLACNRYIEKIENTLVFDSVEEEIYVECDKDMIERILLNLLSNSVKYGKRGGTILVDIDVDDETVFIHVKNNGYIIDKEIQPYIFDKFTKINKSLSREREGSGLGLFLSKRLIELQGGSIEFRSNDEIGTEFILKLKRCYDIDQAEEEEIFEMNPVDDKVDTEFSDIYL
ncbi:ATP-binding protein [Clostridium paraputrificum]|uniref:ATP-binding protein n=1 Tax=Clostridium TaxID=1485 RepID=UPI003D3406E4